MRVMTVLLVVLAAAGCDSVGDVGGSPASSGEGQVFTAPAIETEVDPPELQPPPIVLENRNGQQAAVQGSYCVEYEDGLGAGAGGV